MIRTRCTFTNESGVQCKKSSRARIKHELCRECHVIRFSKPRSIESREVVRHGYRRVRSRRRVAAVKTTETKKKR